jgi:hypothetical protein
MKRMLELVTIGLLLSPALTPSKAATTNYWVQNVNLALKAYVQVDGQIVQGTISTKQFLAFLSGIQNPALVSSETVGTATNNVYTNLTVEVTNALFLPVTSDPPGDLPRSYTITSNYVVTPDGGLTLYTNNVNFTNDVVFTRTSAADATYSFNNAVTFNTNQTAYLFPQLPATYLTAVWTNHGPGVVFVLRGSFFTNVIGLATNKTYGANPDFSQKSGAKLLFITPIVGGTNLASRYVVRYKEGRNYVDVDVSNFLRENSYSPYLAVYGAVNVVRQVRSYSFSEIDFNNQAGTSFNFNGFDSQLWGVLVSKGTLLSPAVLRQRRMDASNYGGYITGQIKDRTFKNSTILVSGSISITGGKVE